MRFTPNRILVSIVVAASVCSVSFAQRVDPFDAKVANMSLLQPKPVQKDVGVTEAQRAKLNAAASQNAQKVQAFVKDAQAKKVPESSLNPSNPVLAGYYEELKAKVFQILTPSQVRRLRELTLQREGTVGLTNSAVVARLGIGKPQETQIRHHVGVFEEYAEQTSRSTAEAVFQQYKNVQPKNQADLQRLRQESRQKVEAAELRVRPQIIAAEKAMTAKVLALLTPSQRSAWKALQGKEFHVK